MTRKIVNVLKYILPVGIAILLLNFAFRNVEFAEFWQKARSVDYTWVFISIGLSLVTYWLRAYRWNLLLKPLGYTQLTVNRTALAILVGYLANLAFPRLGEVTRCGILNRNDDVPVSISLGTVITERVIDLFSLMILTLLALVIEADTLMKFVGAIFTVLGDQQDLAFKGILILLGLLLIGAAVIYIGMRSGGRMRDFILQLTQGILSLRRIQKVPAFILSTIALWVVYYYMSFVIIYTLEESSFLPWEAGIMVLVASGIALAIPIQGGFGTYHTMISGMLLLYGVNKTTGVFLATLLHTSQVISMAVFGGVAVIISIFIRKHKNSEVENRKNSAR